MSEMRRGDGVIEGGNKTKFVFIHILTFFFEFYLILSNIFFLIFIFF